MNLRYQLALELLVAFFTAQYLGRVPHKDLRVIEARRRFNAIRGKTMNQIAMEFSAPMRTVITPAARRSDPMTSHLAAEQHTASGKRAHQQAKAIAAVRAFPGKTSFEIAMATGIDRYELARRLPECVTAGAVRKGDSVDCSVTGRKATTWLPT